MGFFQSIFGSNTGAGYQAHGVSSTDLQNAAGQVGNSQANQNALLAALQGQSGIQSQSNTFNEGQGLYNALAGVNGVGNEQAGLQGLQGLVGQQQGLASQYQDLAAGRGPNPAQAQLAQNTAANVAQTGALMAGQRGAGANVGLLARQAGQQGAQTQQQAAGQAATLQAQQQLAGMQGLAQQQQAIGQTQQAIAGIGSNQIGQQMGQFTNNANLSTQQIGQLLAAYQQAGNMALGNQSNVYGLQSNINTTQAGIAAGNQKAQAGLIGGVLGSVGAGSNALSSTGSYAEGGKVKKMAQGGNAPPPQVQMPNAPVGTQPQQGPQSSFGQFLMAQQQGGRGLTQDPGKSGYQGGQGLYQLGKAGYKLGKSIYDKFTPNAVGTATDTGAGGTSTIAGGQGEVGAGAAGAEGAEAAGAAEAGEAADSADLLLAASGGQIEPGYSPHEPDPSTVGGTLEDIMGYLNAKGGMLAKGGMVNVVLSPGEKTFSPNEAKKVAQGGYASGKTVPGKAKYAGDTIKNDTVPAKLPAGTIVVPRTKVGNPRNFIAATLAKGRHKK